MSPPPAGSPRSSSFDVLGRVDRMRGRNWANRLSVRVMDHVTEEGVKAERSVQAAKVLLAAHDAGTLDESQARELESHLTEAKGHADAYVEERSDLVENIAINLSYLALTLLILEPFYRWRTRHQKERWDDPFSIKGAFKELPIYVAVDIAVRLGFVGNDYHPFHAATWKGAWGEIGACIAVTGAVVGGARAMQRHFGTGIFLSRTLLSVVFGAMGGVVTYAAMGADIGGTKLTKAGKRAGRNVALRWGLAQLVLLLLARMRGQGGGRSVPASGAARGVNLDATSRRAVGHAPRGTRAAAPA